MDTCTLIATRTPYRITRPALAKIELGRKSVFDYELWAISIALDINPLYLMGITDDPTPAPSIE